MEKVLKPLAILNLTGELSSELDQYFKSRNVLVVDPLVSKDEPEWTHIITKDIHDFSLINKTYDLHQKDIHIISLSRVQDLQNFTINNGNIILDDVWFKGPMGPFIMDKYFQGYGGITLGDNYPTFKEQGAFNITNPFNTGEYLDRMVQTAFDGGAPALTVKTFFDHLVMYIAGLKNGGKAGLPFEVTYGVFDQIFALQFHFFASGLDLLDVTTSLSSNVTKKAEEYYLNVSVQATDFFDFSYMPEVNKVVITGLWTQDERIKFENRGLMFTSLVGGRILTSHQTGDVTSTLIPASEIKDHSDKIVIPDHLPEEVVETTLVKGLGLEPEGVTKVQGHKDERSDEPSIVSGAKDLEELVNIVKGKFEEDKSAVRVSAGKLDIDQAAYRIAANVDTSAKESNLKIRSLGEKLPEAIKTGLFDFAKGLSKPVEELNDADLDSFQLVTLPGIIKDEILNEIHVDDKTHLVTGEETSDEPLLIKGASELDQLINVIKGRFEDDKEIVRIEETKKLDVDKAAYRIAATIDESTKETNLKVRSLGDKLPDTIKTGLFDFAKFLNKEVEDLNDSDLDDFQVQRLPEIIQQGILNQKLIGGANAANTNAVSPQVQILESKLLSSHAENERLKNQLKTLASEVRILKDSRTQMADMQKRALQAATEAAQTSGIPDQDEELRKHFQQKLAEQKSLSDQELQKLGGLLERESKLIAEIKNEEMKARKLQIESLQKETFFGQEIEKANRQLKAKDSVVIKTKETFVKLVEKKEKEISDLKNKLDQLSKALSGGPSQNQTIILKELERQNQNLTKQIDVYRAKVTSLSNKMQKNDEGNAKEDLRKLQMLTNQMKNQVDFAKKEMLKLSEKSIQDNAHLTALKHEKAKLEQMLKKATEESKEASVPVSVGIPADNEAKRLQAQNQILENQMRDAQAKIVALEGKLVEVSKPQRQVANGEDSSKVKVSQLENSVKKLTQDLVDNKNQLAEAKKETNKLRQEKTALQNQIDKMRKEAEKAKTASPKKPSGKAA